MSEASAAQRCANVLVGQLIAQGVTDVVLCPGSRSAPLALAAHAADAAGALRLHVRIDERSAAFCALFCSAVFCPASFLTSCTEARYSVLSASRLALAAMVAESLAPSVAENTRTCCAAAATCVLSAS